MKIFSHFSITIGWLFEQSQNLSKKNRPRDLFLGGAF